MYTIGQFSIITKIPKKTLRYYDGIDLLKPAIVDCENNYRYYDNNSLLTAQQILIYRSCEISLDNIKGLLRFSHNQTELKSILISQLDFLQMKSSEIRKSQSVLRKIISSLEVEKMGNVIMQEHKESHVLSIRRRGNHDSIGGIISTLFETALKHKLKVAGPHTIIRHEDKDFGEDEVDMEIYIPVEGSVEINLEMLKVKKSQRYCELIHRGSMLTISSAYSQIFLFIKKNGLKIDGPFEETFLSDMRFTEPDNFEINVAVPVREAV